MSKCVPVNRTRFIKRDLTIALNPKAQDSGTLYILVLISSQGTKDISPVPTMLAPSLPVHSNGFPSSASLF
jgi:hypothetical protein